MRRRILSSFTKAALGLSLPILLGVLPLLRAEEHEAVPDPVNIFIDVQMVALPRPIALPLVRELMDREKIEGACTRIQDLLDQGTAKLMGWPMLTAQSGNRSTFEAGDELPHGTIFEPGRTAITVTKTKPADAAGQVGQAPQLPTGRNAALEATELNPVVLATETRRLGVALELDPLLAEDGKTITIDIVPQHVRLKGMTKIAVENGKTHDKVSIEQPEIETMKTNTSVILKSGERILLGVFPTSEPPDHLELFILRAEAK